MFCFRSVHERRLARARAHVPSRSEIDALLGFTPVDRRTRRRDGWPADVQRGFVAALAECGNAGKAAHVVGRTMSGAYKVRTAGGAESFALAWTRRSTSIW